MRQKLERKFVLITRRTRYSDALIRHSTASQAKFRAQQIGGDWNDIEEEHTEYADTVRSVERILGQLARVVTVERDLVPTHLFTPLDILVCIGQDGLVANSLKYTDGQPVLGINPDPNRFDGVLLGWNGADSDRIQRDCERALDSKLPYREVTMAEASLADGQTIRGVNDIFLGLRDHRSSRYQIAHNGQRERQSSSGVLVTTGLGSTGWLKSVVTTAGTISSILSGEDSSGGHTVKLNWNDQQLIFSVREAFPSKWTQSKLVFGKITAGQPLTIISENPDGGIIFSDGMPGDALEFNAPQRAEITLASAVGRIGWPSS